MLPGCVNRDLLPAAATYLPQKFRIAAGVLVCSLLIIHIQSGNLHACSTFKLQKGNELLYGHNLNQPGMNVPGLIFINKRGIFKVGRSASEMLTMERLNPSTLSWISRYGSVTFSTFGKDMPDGGVNEAGLYIWEMNDQTEYPKNNSLPKLIQMNWMQYVLDTCSDVNEAVDSTRQIEIGGWGWHYFVGDSEGRCATVEFIRGQVVVHRGESMPVPALFNEPYARELEIARYFKNFGGIYAVDLNDPRVPRFVKTAQMIREYDTARDAVAYGIGMLDGIKVNDVPDWSILVDIRRRNVHFKTFLNPNLKWFSMEGLDFSNSTPAMILNMDQAKGGNVDAMFHPAAEGEIREFISSLPLPDAFYAESGITKADFVERFSTHSRAAAEPARQFFRGVWRTRETLQLSGSPETTVELNVAGDSVTGVIGNAKGEKYSLDHIQLIQSKVSFTFRNMNGTVYIVKGGFEKDRLDLELWGIDGFLRSFTLYRQ